MSTPFHKKDGVLPWLMLAGVPSARRCTEASKEKMEEMYECYKEMSRAVEVKKPQEAQKAKALWKMKTTKEEYYDPIREEGIK